jgi:hypothetical protein
LRYCRSRFFTFLFFMQKLSGTSSVKNNKSCMIFYKESNKIGIAFFRFFYNFLQILQDSAKQQHYWRSTFALGSMESFQIHNHTLSLHKTPWKQNRLCNVVLCAVTGAAGGIPTRSSGGAGREWVRGGPGGALGQCGRLGWVKMRPATAVGGAPGRRPR